MYRLHGRYHRGNLCRRDRQGTGLIGLKYIPGIPGLADTIVKIFGESVCAAFLFAGLMYLVALGISFFLDKGIPKND